MRALDAATIECVEIEPSYWHKDSASLTDTTLRVTEPGLIAGVVEKLRQAQLYRTEGLRPKWDCTLVFHGGEDVFSCTVSSTKHNGVLIRLQSRESPGTNYGTFRMDSLGPILEGICREKTKLHSTEKTPSDSHAQTTSQKPSPRAPSHSTKESDGNEAADSDSGFIARTKQFLRSIGFW